VKKVYRYEATDGTPVLTVLKWLRSQGELNVDFKILGANYSRIEISFNNDKLELAYTLKYDWAK
jgi:hypothetical protein